MLKAAWLGLGGLVGLAALSVWVHRQSEPYLCSLDTVPRVHTAIVLGCYVDDSGELCGMLTDRVRTAADLYHVGKVDRLLMSGDAHEVEPMRRVAETLGVAPHHIDVDPAGFSTWDSMVRARDVFHVGRAVVVTQDFHLARSIFLARTHGIEAWGVPANRRRYQDMPYYHWRDGLARCKDAVLALFYGGLRWH